MGVLLDRSNRGWELIHELSTKVDYLIAESVLIVEYIIIPLKENVVEQLTKLLRVVIAVVLFFSFLLRYFVVTTLARGNSALTVPQI